MARPTDQQVDWLAQTMAARMLTDAADTPREAQLEQALRFWLPTDDVTALELVEIRKAVQGLLRELAAAVGQRLAKRVEIKRAQPLPGCDGRI